MQYALLIYDDKAVWAELPEAAQNRILGEYRALDEAPLPEEAIASRGGAA